MLLVMGTLLIGELAGSASLIAAPMQIAQGQTSPATSPPNQVRRSIRQAVRRDLAEHLNIRRRQVQIVSIERQTWPDGCLGLLSNRNQTGNPRAFSAGKMSMFLSHRR